MHYPINGLLNHSTMHELSDDVFGLSGGDNEVVAMGGECELGALCLGAAAVR